MKLSVIMPVIDVPIGSGRPCPWLRNAIDSTINCGHKDFELLVGCDGDIQAIRELVESFKDDRVKYIAFPATRSWGNYQRHELMKNHATGDYFSFMDHDDEYIRGSLKDVADEVKVFPERAFFFRVNLACGITVWTEESRTGRNKPSINVAGQGMIVPRGNGWPLWPNGKNRTADKEYTSILLNHADKIGKPIIFSKHVISNIRPLSPPELTNLGFASSPMAVA